MKTIQYIFVLIAFVTLTNACVPSPMYTPQTKITFDWQQTTPGATHPDQWTIRLYPQATGGTVYTLPATASGFAGEIPPGIYRLLALHPAIAPAEITDSSDYNAARFFIPLPADAPADPAVASVNPHFSVATEWLEVKVAGNTSLTLPVRQHVVPVAIYIKGTGLEYIRNLSGRLSGIATAVRLASGETESSGQACHCFTFPDAPQPLASSFGLLGVVPEAEQQLSLSLVYTDGSAGQLTTNVTEAFRGVNTQKHLPVSLECTVDIHRQSGTFSAGIVKWEIVDMGEIVPQTDK